MRGSLPKLDTIIEKCYQINTSLSAKQQTQAVLAAFALLGHLKAEREYIRVLDQGDELSKKLPSPTEIPAMTAVLQDDRLFRVLINCLISPLQSETSSHQQELVAGGRKRSLSVGVEPPNKHMKMASGARKPDSDSVSPSIFWPGFACTVFASALLHLDHWPAILLHAYAQDSFGPRHWVDHSDCEALVKNLRLSHARSPSIASDEGQFHSAALVADAYRGFVIEGISSSVDNNQTDRGRVFSPKRRESISSYVSTGPIGTSMSVDSTAFADESDSGEEEQQILSTVGGDDGESSSGDDEEMVVDSRASTTDRRRPIGETERTTVGTYPLYIQKNLNLEPVRERFIGTNRALAHDFIGQALTKRLGMKSKQNSGLLQALPMFVSIASVRKQIASNLERWLQSPALSGLSRQLLVNTVNNLENCDPPLQDDVEAIEYILRMKLKVNQLNAHIESVTTIATLVPTATVINCIYGILLRETMGHFDHQISKQPSDHLGMLTAVHSRISPQLSYDAMAASILSMLVAFEQAEGNERAKRESIVRRLRLLIRAVASQLQKFDAFALLESILSFEIDVKSWSIRDEEDKARLLFQCITLCVAQFTAPLGKRKHADHLPVNENLDELRTKLKKIRHIMLLWCCGVYGSKYRSKSGQKGEGANSEPNPTLGAGVPDFSCIMHDSTIKLPVWLRIARCVLFLEEPGSALMKQFVCPGDSLAVQDDWDTELSRISVCAQHGRNVDDEMIWSIVKSFASDRRGISAEMALQLIEHLIDCCKNGKGGALSVSDPMLVWELYTISGYQPTLTKEISDSQLSSQKTIPKLAYPGLWWRTNIIALIMCAASPNNIGNVMWVENPTLRSLMKMVTSARLIFPTVDCGDDERDRMSQDEQAARDEELRIAELLFLPARKVEPKKTNKLSGSRVSKRILKQRKKRAEAEELAELNRRKELLRTGQRSIMLWDPDGPARKPPKQLGDLFMTVEEAFSLSSTFQRCRSPDFVLRTIGETTRGAIERAHLWLVPIISDVPETIERLPSNATCLLLLRSFGNENRERLESLIAPLFEHVRESLHGKFGKSNAIEALDLLLGDMASLDQNRRRCAVRVLDETLGNGLNRPTSWIHNILTLEHADSMVPSTIKHMSVAAEFENGAALESMLTGLYQHISFAGTRGISVSSSFTQLLLRFMSQRPFVFAELLVAFEGIRKLITETLHDEFCRCLSEGEATGSPVQLFLSVTKLGNGKVFVSLPLLHASCVLLSVHQDDLSVSSPENLAVYSKLDDLLDALMVPDKADVSSMREPDRGLCTATFASSGEDALLVDSWILLSKARGPKVARRAALSAPLGFLPRLLLCSGLPLSSCSTMLNRLDTIAGTSDDPSESFRKLLAGSPSASQWDFSRVGSRKDFAKKLSLRLRAYSRLSKSCGSAPRANKFVDWLHAEVNSESVSKASKTKPKKVKAKQTAPLLSTIAMASSILEDIKISSNDLSSTVIPPLSCDSEQSLVFRKSVDTQKPATEVPVLVRTKMTSGSLALLDNLLQDRLSSMDADEKSMWASSLLRTFRTKNDSTSRDEYLLEKWIPLLTQGEPSKDVLTEIFSYGDITKTASIVLESVAVRCAKVWRTDQIHSSISWLLQPSLAPNLSSQIVARFLTSISGVETNGADIVQTSRIGRIRVEDQVTMQRYIIGSIKDGSEDEDELFLSSLTNYGKLYLQRAADELCRVAAAGSASNSEIKSLQTTLLRMYIARPLWMNLGSPMIRAGLLKASLLNKDTWGCWSSSLDYQLDGVLNGLFQGETKLSKTLSDLSRKHPLLLFRKTKSIIARLRRDASPLFAAQAVNQRNIVLGSIALPASYLNKTVTVHVRHWGCVFHEAIWVTLLDAFSAIPREVLLGPNLGFYDVLTLYVQLVLVQTNMNTRDRISRLKAKLNNCFTVLKQSAAIWKEWLDSEIDETQMRNLLVSCDFLSPSEAIESL